MMTTAAAVGRPQSRAAQTAKRLLTASEQSSADSEEAAAMLHQMLAEAGGAPSVRVYLLVEPSSTAVPVDLPLDATLLQLKAAARREGAPIPALQQLTVGGRLVTGSDSAPLSATLVQPNGVVAVRAKPPRSVISVGGEHAVVLLADGRIAGWGEKEFWSPVPDLPNSVVSVHAGRGVTAAVVDGEVQCWGQAPVGPVVRQPRGQRVVSCSAAASCYGAVAAVCDGGYLHLSGNAEMWFGAPPACLQGRAAAVSCGGTLVAVLTREGAVFAFGDKLQCTEADLGGMAAVHVSAGGSHYGALMGDGSVRCFGANDCGQCDVPSELRNVVSIACGVRHTVGLLADGSVLGWGKSLDMSRIVDAGPCAAVAAGDDVTVAATVDGKLVSTDGRIGRVASPRREHAAADRGAPPTHEWSRPIGASHLSRKIGLRAVTKVITVPQHSRPHLIAKRLEELREEMDAWKSLSHPHIVGYLEAEWVDGKLEISTPLAAGSVKFLLAFPRAPPDGVAALLTEQMVRGLEHLHLRDIAHRNLKCANLLLTQGFVCKIADFGVEPHILDSDDEHRAPRAWTAPEVYELLSSDVSHWRRADVWSVGCTVMEMLTRLRPWVDVSPAPEDVLRIARSDIDIRRRIVEALPPTTPSASLAFIQSCLRRSPADRPSVQALLRHLWLRSVSLRSQRESECYWIREARSRLQQNAADPVRELRKLRTRPDAW
eukprot:TRINITY_DN335_c0_g1_i7.p1 TRINITY_DN335_c0_g1~~TRINITY_DN335_c0_g1_i7.p1  ORF type:complete len:713 (+),score=190.02 TRINITY_DN335_c0_g1_i7:493-2631(+)